MHACLVADVIELIDDLRVGQQTLGTVKGRMRLGYEKIEAIKRESEPLDGETLQRAA